MANLTSTTSFKSIVSNMEQMKELQTKARIIIAQYDDETSTTVDYQECMDAMERIVRTLADIDLK